MKKINLEDNSEEVRIGRVLHEERNESKNSEISLENIKIDKITSQYVIEYKKSDADLFAAEMQLKFYLDNLERKGIKRKGRIEIFEKNKQNKKIHYVELGDKEKREIQEITKEIEKLYEQDYPPKMEEEKKCKKCAYYEYCDL